MDTAWVRLNVGGGCGSLTPASLRGMFPTLRGQSGYNKRVRAAGPLVTALAKDTPSWHELLRLMDSAPVPTGMSRETAKRSDLAGDAGYGYCASHSRHFWEFRLYLIATPEGTPMLWALAKPRIGECEVTQATVETDHNLIRDGRVVLGNKGFAGR